MRFDFPIQCAIRLCEVTQDENNVPVSANIDISKVIGDDANPMFVNLEVLRSYEETGNKRTYTDQAIMDIAELLPGVQGFLGHPDPSKTDFEFRIPQNIYVGSKLNSENGSIKCLGKTYIFRTSDLREWIPAALAAGNPITVSIWGRGDVSVDPYTGAKTVHRVTQLDSVDWANPGTQGAARSSVLSIVSEMTSHEGGTQMNPNERLQVIAGASLQEIRSGNPNAVNEILRGATLAEIQAANPNLVTAIQDGSRISEIAVKVGGTEKKVKLAEIQSMVDGFETQIAEIKQEHECEKHLAEMIATEVPEEHREKVAKRISIKGQTKDQITQAVKDEVAYLSEITGHKPADNKPAGARERKDGGDDGVREGLARRFGTYDTLFPKK